MVNTLRLSGAGMMSSANARVDRGSSKSGSPLTPLESQIWGIAAQFVLVLGRFASLLRSVDGADSRKGRQRAVMLFEGVAGLPAVGTIELVAGIIG